MVVSVVRDFEETDKINCRLKQKLNHLKIGTFRIRPRFVKENRKCTCFIHSTINPELNNNIFFSRNRLFEQVKKIISQKWLNNTPEKYS